MDNIRGTALFCGLDYSVEEMERHLLQAHEAGINAVFTSLQLPEADKQKCLRDFPKMAEIAHKYGMKVEADLGPRTANMFGIGMMDFKALSQIGVDIMRMDGGYTPDQTVEATHNKEGLIVSLNAAIVTSQSMERLIGSGICRENAVFCHNYHPMMYTGLKPQKAKENNDLIHSYGFTVSGFLASQHHKRIGCSLGLPTVEQMRYTPVDVAARQAMILGFDGLYFGDDFASLEEMKILVGAKPGAVTFRLVPEVKGDVMDWLIGRELKQMQYGLDEIVRSNFLDKESIYAGGFEDSLVRPRKKGDVCMCKAALLRYAGEVQICRTDLPADENIGVIGHIATEDLPLLDSFIYKGNFKFV